jgi:putative Mn2+ efflux pump MntP
LDTLTLVVTAFALAMDAFAVSIASGVSLKKVSIRQTFRLAFHFGFFQALMPVIGWSGGLTVRSLIEQYDHWVAFLLLALVGGHMIREAFHKDQDKKEKNDPTKGITLLMLSVATSIDALAVGLSLSILNISIWFPALIIGIVAALATAAGLHIGKRVGASSHMSQYAECIGGIVLLLIGVRILYEHGVFAGLF